MTSAIHITTATLIGFGSIHAAAAVNAQDSLTITPMAEGLEAPWGVAPLPGGGLLVTEKAGRLIHEKDGARHEISGLPEVAVVGQGGLLPVTCTIEVKVQVQFSGLLPGANTSHGEHLRWPWARRILCPCSNPLQWLAR